MVHHVNDVVRFRVEDKILTGVVAVRDVYYDDDNNETIEYDIIADEDGVLYKHVPENFIVEFRNTEVEIFGKPVVMNLTEEILREVEELKKPRWESGYLISKLGK